MTQPTAEQLLNLADRTPHGLTPDETARLRDGISLLAELLRDTEGDRDSWANDAKRSEAEADTLREERHTYQRAWHSARDRARKERARAEQAEAELTALKTITSGYCGHCGRGDCSPTADQWYEQRQRADRAEAAIERVRATCARLHDLAHAAHGVPTSSYDRGIDRAAKVILAALDEPQEQQSGTRPTHPDGTPYRYAEIAAEGWEHCDGCGQWGNTWTPEQPHRCPAPIKVATAPAP